MPRMRVRTSISFLIMASASSILEAARFARSGREGLVGGSRRKRADRPKRERAWSLSRARLSAVSSTSCVLRVSVASTVPLLERSSQSGGGGGGASAVRPRRQRPSPLAEKTQSPLARPWRLTTTHSHTPITSSSPRPHLAFIHTRRSLSSRETERSESERRRGAPIHTTLLIGAAPPRRRLAHWRPALRSVRSQLRCAALTEAATARGPSNDARGTPKFGGERAAPSSPRSASSSSTTTRVRER
jgi:hypothetical protein